MAGIKRKSTAPASALTKKNPKKLKVQSTSTGRHASADATRSAKLSTKAEVQSESDDLIESDTSEGENGFYGFSANTEAQLGSSDAEETLADDENGDVRMETTLDGSAEKEKDGRKDDNRRGKETNSGVKKPALAALNATSSREAHAKQKALAKERKAAKPNAEIVEQSKVLWERLRLKSHVEKGERKKLVEELFELVTGRVKDLVFKHDSVRVVQCAIKYSTIEQRRMIARELKGEFKPLAEGKYSKFLIAKLLEKGDPEIRELILSEFYGSVKRLINHPEAAWILDDTYRAVATPEQKARLLREWYGPEFSIRGLKAEGIATAELPIILAASPEKRQPIMDHLEVQINQIIQKKFTGFTMLHDAMLQYFLACKPGSNEANNFLEHLRPDPTIKEGEEADNVDLLKNLAFTKSGSRLVSLALAYGTAKDRKLFLKPYKDAISMMAYDANAHQVLLAALAVVDDTKLTAKSIFGELLPSNDTLSQKVLDLASDARSRTVLLYPFAADAKWLLDDNTRDRLSEIYAIRESTSKKDPATRLHEIERAIEPQLLTAITARASDFASFGFGLQAMGEILVGAPEIEPQKRREALNMVAQISQQILDASAQGETAEVKGKRDVATLGSKMLKTLVQGGKFDPSTRKVIPIEPALGFANLFWDQIKDNVIQWAVGQGSFVIVALVESEDFGKKDEVLKALRKDRKRVEAAAGPSLNDGRKNGDKKGKREGNAGARILLQKL